MLTGIRFFTIFFSFSLLYSEPNLVQKNNLWYQIIPLIGNADITKAQNPEEGLKACTAQAMLLNGRPYKALDSEMFQTLKSLHLFSYVLPKISLNTLRLGYFSFAKNMCQITDDLGILRDRAAYATYLYNNSEIGQKLNETLESLKIAEADFLANFYSKPPKKENEPADFLEEGVKLLETAEKKILTNRYTGEIYKRMNLFTSLAFIYGSAYSIYNISEFYKDKISGTEKFWKPVLGERFAKEFASAPTTAIPYTALAVMGTVLFTIGTAKGLKADFDLSYQRNKSLLLLKDLIKASQAVVKLVQKNPEFEQFLPEYPIIKKFADYKKHSAQLGNKMVHLMGLLDYYPFNSQANYYLSWQGKIHETFLLYEEIHHEFMPLWQAFAELDAQLCVQKLLNNEPHAFCIPEWIDQQNPVLKVHGYWHPIISAQKAVANDMTLGTANSARNSIITGANAGGKTTAMTALMLCAVLGQSIGIVPAQSYTATPFARMHTYLDITTNLAENESLFMAQANRAKHLYESIKSCNPNEKTFTILDEIFTGTRADFAEKASYQFAQTLGQMPHSICIIATHFPKLTELETTQSFDSSNKNLFVNYQASAATINEDGSLTYPYLIVPGISTQNIADHILKNKGILQA
jgi:hypothetical protein